jgi:hypothetical protein
MRTPPKIPDKIRHVKLIKRVANFLAECGPKNTRQILDHVNTTTRHGTTPSELSNVLAKTRFFHNTGEERVSAVLSGDYKVIIWDIVED